MQIVLKSFIDYIQKTFIFTHFHFVSTEQLAEDIMQEAFLKGILSLDDNHENVKAWLFMVCRNLWIDYIRKNEKLSKIDINEIEVEDCNRDILKKVSK